MSTEQQALLRRFITACEADRRIIAAFLGGSFASGSADAYSDLDIYLITTSEEYDAFFAERHVFMQRLGDPVFLDDFNDFGFDMLLFTFADGVEGELALARESNFSHVHGGAYRVLVDKKDILANKVFPMLEPTEEGQVKALRQIVYYFWEDLSHAITLLHRGHLWLAMSQIDQMRRKCVNLARLQQDFMVEIAGYRKAEQDLPAERLRELQETFCAFDKEIMKQATGTLVHFYKERAPILAERHGIDYPVGLDRVNSSRLERLLM